MPRLPLDDKMMQDALDLLRINPNISAAVTKVGTTPKQFYRWLQSERLIAWPDRAATDKLRFREAYALCRRMQAVEHDARIREAVLLGDEIQIPGEWQVDAALIAEFAQYGEQAAEVAATLGVFDYPYAHRENEKGQLERIVRTIRQPAPATLRIHAARALVPGYNVMDKSEVSQKVASTVLVLGATQMPELKPYHRDYVAPAQIEPPKQQMTTADKIAEIQARIEAKRSSSPLVADLLAHASTPPKNPTPQGPVRTNSARADDPVEQITGGPAAEPLRPSTVNVGDRRRFHPPVAPGGYRVR